MSADNGYDILCDPSINIGDKGVFTEVYLQSYGQIKSKVRRYLPNESEAEEVVQETFLKVLKGQFDHRSPPIYWLSKIASRAAIDRIRHKKKSADNNAASIDEDPAVLNRAPVHLQNHHVLQASYLDRILRELPEQDQTLLRMKYIEEKSYEEISELTNIGVNTVKTKIFRALQKAGDAALKLNLPRDSDDKSEPETQSGAAVENGNPKAFMSPALSRIEQAMQLYAKGKSEREIASALNVKMRTAHQYVNKGVRLQGYRNGKNITKPVVVFDQALLTKREAEVVRLKDVEGQSFEEIADTLHISVGATRNHMGHAYRKGYTSPVKPPELSDREYQFARLMIQDMSYNDIAKTLRTTAANVGARLVDAQHKFPDMKSLKAAIERKTQEISQNSSSARKVKGGRRFSQGVLTAAI